MSFIASSTTRWWMFLGYAQAAVECMMVNTILELADVDEALCRLAARELGRVETLFESYFEQAQDDGDYARELRAADLAAHVMLLNQGRRVAAENVFLDANSRTGSTRSFLAGSGPGAMSLAELREVKQERTKR